MDIEKQLLIRKVKDTWGGKVEKEGDRVVGPFRMPTSPAEVDVMIESLTEVTIRIVDSFPSFWLLWIFYICWCRSRTSTHQHASC